MRVNVENSFQRSMQILELFSEEKALIAYGDIAERFGFTKSSTYRYLSNLIDAGFIAAVGNGLYSLGPRLIELERLIVLSDPLLASGRKVMPAMVDEVADSALLLCSLWGERVLCIHEVRSSASNARATPFVPRRGRGVPYTLFEGAASVVLLANLPAYKLRSVYRRHGQDIAAQSLGQDWSEFAKVLKAIRAKGYAYSIDTFHTGRISVATPILDGMGKVVGSLSRVAEIGSLDRPESVEAIAVQLKDGAARITAGMSAILMAHDETGRPTQEGLFRSATPLPPAI
jgi:DNA-binding IclR family transcriptional regulator